MKKIIASIMMIVIIMVTGMEVVTAIDLPLRVELDGEKLNFPDVQPFIDAQGRTQSPSRFIGESLGAEVTWEGDARTATFTTDEVVVVITIDKKEYTINGKVKMMDTVAIIKEGRTFVPARYIAEALGASVRWDGVVKTVYITSGAGNIEVEDGTTTYYDGVGFNPETDTFPTSDLMTEAKSAEFCMNLMKDVELTMENGRYMINATYPGLPEGYYWYLNVDVNYGDIGGSRAYSTQEYFEKYEFPATGTFSKDITDLLDSKDIDYIYIIVKVISPTKLTSGHLDIVSDAKSDPSFERRCHYVCRVSVDSIILTDQLDFEKLFQWN